jgi:hypothetical protein
MPDFFARLAGRLLDQDQERLRSNPSSRFASVGEKPVMETPWEPPAPAEPPSISLKSDGGTDPGLPCTFY